MNNLTLNEATLKKALEHWLNTQVFDSLAMVQVLAVTVNSGDFVVDFAPLPAPVMTAQDVVNEALGSLGSTLTDLDGARPFAVDTAVDGERPV